MVLVENIVVCYLGAFSYLKCIYFVHYKHPFEPKISNSHRHLWFDQTTKVVCQFTNILRKSILIIAQTQINNTNEPIHLYIVILCNDAFIFIKINQSVVACVSVYMCLVLFVYWKFVCNFSSIQQSANGNHLSCQFGILKWASFVTVAFYRFDKRSWQHCISITM